MRLWIFCHLLTVLPPHGEDADEEGERGHDNLTTSLSTTFSRFFLIITSQGWVAQNSPWLRNTFLNISMIAEIQGLGSNSPISGWHLWTHLTVGVSIVASPVRGPAVARALRRNRSDLLFTRLSIHSCVKDIPE